MIITGYADTRPDYRSVLLYIAPRTPDTSLYSAATCYRSACVREHYNDWLGQSAQANVALFNTENRFIKTRERQERTLLENAIQDVSQQIHPMNISPCLFLLLPLRLQIRRPTVI
jgi:hypothetical protein